MERVADPAAILHDSRMRRNLGAAKRKFLLAAVRCFRVVATDVLRVIF